MVDNDERLKTNKVTVFTLKRARVSFTNRTHLCLAFLLPFFRATFHTRVRTCV